MAVTALSHSVEILLWVKNDALISLCSLSGGARHCIEQDLEHMVMVVGVVGGGFQVPELVQSFDIKSRVYVLQTLTTFSLFLDVAGLMLHSSFTDS